MAHTHGPNEHGDRGRGRAFAIGVVLNLVFIIVEVIFGITSNSVALISDAAHNLGDVLGLVLAWIAFALAKRKASQRRTYGLRSTTILAALTNAVLLFVAVGAVAWESIGRFRSPSPVEGTTVIIVAAIGVLINGASALLFLKGRHDDVNVKGAFMHLAADAVVSLGVVIAGVVIIATGWWWLDPAIGIVVSVVVLIGTRPLFREALDLALHAVPAKIDPTKVREYLAGLPDVVEVHDLHIWAMSTTEAALTAHLVVADGAEPLRVCEVAAEVERAFGVGHCTLQIERASESARCSLAAPAHS